MKFALLPLITSLFVPQLTLAQGLLPTTGYQEVQEEQEENEKRSHQVTPEWVIELSNLSEADRNAYLQAFQAAKRAYAANRLAVCESHLNTCELYFTENPNVWILRSSVLISQGQYDKAERYLNKAEKADPDNSVIKLNKALLHMAVGDYKAALRETDDLLYQMGLSANTYGTRRSLTYRKFLCLLMLDKETEARELIADISPMDDSPLFYYCEAAFCMLRGDTATATRELNTADAIFARDGHLPSYKQNLMLSGLRDKISKKKP